MGHIVTVIVDGCEIREIALDLSDAGWDQRLLEGLQGIGQEVATVLLRREDEALRRQVPAEWQNLGRERRQLETLAGKVTISRRVYRDEQGVRHKPLDAALGLSAYRRGTPSLERMAAYLASGTSYRRAAEQLGWMVGRRVNPTRIQRSVWAVGQALTAQEQAERAAVFERGEVPPEGQLEAKILFAEADGVWIRLQREKRRSAEVRVGILYTGKQPLGKGRWQLADKTCVTALVKDSQEWQELMLLAAFGHYHLSGTERAVLNGDGAEWVRHSLDRLELPVHFQLDRFHIFRAARQAGPALPALARLACREGLPAVEPQLRQLIRQARPEEQPKLLEFYDYLRHNADALIDYRLRLNLPLPPQAGLGAIEGNVDKLVVQRLKGRGMSWRLAGAKAMLALCRHRPALRSQTLTPRSAPPLAQTNRPLDCQRPSDDDRWLQASVPLLHSSDENSPLGRKLRGIVNGQPGLAR